MDGGRLPIKRTWRHRAVRLIVGVSQEQEPMHPDSRIPNEPQRKKLCDMLHFALSDIRQLGYTGNAAQAADLADAFHNLPQEIWADYFSISFFREAFLVPYYRKWPTRGPYDYLALLDEVEELK
jgi:hypothetical protein